MPRVCAPPMPSDTSTEVMTIVSENGNEFSAAQERVPVYELQSVSKSYALGGGQVHAVKELDLTIESGDAVAIVGPSGSGKTTLLQLLGGLDRPSTGSVRFEGRDMAAMGDGELSSLRLRTIGFVFQQFNLIPTLTRGSECRGRTCSGRPEAGERREMVRGLLESVGLGERGDHVPGKLSGGEQQRVAIARALANCTARAARRRADRQSGHGDRRGDSRPSHVAVGSGAHGDRRHARHGCGPARAPDHPYAGRALGSRSRRGRDRPL